MTTKQQTILRCGAGLLAVPVVVGYFGQTVLAICLAGVIIGVTLEAYAYHRPR